MHAPAELLSTVRRENPLVHFITNYVTVNDCANITLAAGASPIMADDPLEAAQMAGLCSALVLNMGTPCQRTVEGMLLAGKAANSQGKPVIFDPVGAGASNFRNETALTLLRELRCDVIKGNSAEISFLAGGMAASRGVDASLESLVTEENLAESARRAQKLAVLSGAIIVVSGPIDIVASAHTAWAVRNGHAMMARITGTGCMSAALIGCLAACTRHELGPACVCAMAAMGVCGQLAQQKLQGMDGGNGTYRMLLLDAMSTLSSTSLNAHANIEKLAL